MRPENDSCGIPDACTRAVPAWVVALDNIPTVVMYALGAAILWPIGKTWAVAYVAYSLFSVFLFWIRICPYCHHFGSRGCPCGYGVVSAKLCQPRKVSGTSFRAVFRKNIGIVFPSWFIPLGVGGFLLWRDFSRPLLWLVVAFCAVGFAFIPLVSKLVGCRNCTIKQDCPWMTKEKPDAAGS